MREPRHLALGAVSRLVVGAFLLGTSPGLAEECSSPCTITKSIVPQLQLVDSSSGATTWIARTSSNGAEFQVGPSGSSLTFRIEDDAPASLLFLDALGRVGIGTTTPQEELQIGSTVPAIRLDDTSAGEGRVDLEMNGATFSVTGESDQQVVQVDTRAPTSSLRITDDGRVGLGITSPEARLHVVGDARVEGNVALGSSRNLKTAFGEVSSSEILAQVLDMPVASWRYKGERGTARHIGPFAEDFERLFGLGDGKTISVVDAQGVAFAAIQGLAARNAVLQREIAERAVELEQLRSKADAEIAELTARLAAIEARLDG